MAHPWHDIPVDEPIDDWFPACIEIPQGSHVKYELDKDTGLLRVDRVLFSSVHYPANYGFVPRTYCEDGDALDVLVLGQGPVVPMCVMRARAIGCMGMRDDKGRDDKIVAVHLDDPAVRHYAHVNQVAPHTLAQLRRFFQDYKVLENKEVVVDELEGPEAANTVIRAAMLAYGALRAT